MYSSRDKRHYSPDRRHSSYHHSSGGSQEDYRRSNGSYNRNSTQSRSRSPTDHRHSYGSTRRRPIYDRSPDHRRSSYRRSSGESQEDHYHSNGSMKRRPSYSSDSSNDSYTSRRHHSNGTSNRNSSYGSSQRSYHSSNDRHDRSSRNHSNTSYHRPSTSSSYPSSSGRPVYQKGHSAYVTPQQTNFSSSTPCYANKNDRGGRGQGFRGGRGHSHRGGGGGGRGPGSRKAADDDSQNIAIQPTQNGDNTPVIPSPPKDDLNTVVNAFEITTDRGIPVYQYAIKWKGENNHGKEIKDLNTQTKPLGEYYCFENEFFEKKSSEPISGSPIVLKSGGYRSIRSTENPSILTYHFVPKKTAFYGDFDLITLIEFETRRRIDDIWKVFDAATKTIKNLIVKTTHLNNNRTFNVQGLTEKPADVQTFKLKDKEVTVAEYYFDTYKRKLKRPNLPCVIGNDRSYYPMEVLEIVELQKIPKAKQDEFQHLKISDKCSFTPLENLKAIEKERENCEFLNSNEFIKKTGCRVYPRKLVTASAKQFYPPSIVLKDTQRKLNSGRFGLLAALEGDKFHQPAIVAKLACVFASRKIDKHIAGDFFLDFIKHLKIYGVKIDDDDFKIFEWQDGYAQCDQLCGLEEAGYKYAIIIGDEDDLHHGIKLMELKMNMVTQHIMSDTVAAKPNYSVLDNLAFKFNLRAGGINWSFASDPRMMKKFENVDLLQHLMKNTMLFGIDLSHPSWFNKNNASCVGFASNTMKGQSSICKGDFGYQAPRQTIIDPELLADKFKCAIAAYYVKSGCYPSWIVVYRAGVSEGEIPKVQEKEVSVMKETMEELKKQYPEFRDADVKLTVVMSNEDTNYRLFKEDLYKNKELKAKDPSSQNLPSGTCVTEKSFSHKIPTFVLISQLPKKDKRTMDEETLKPRVYSVLEGAGVVPFDHLQYLTYCLCFSHQICTSPTALPGPLESASDLSKRASNNIRYFLQQNPTFGQSYGVLGTGESKKKDDCLPPEYFKDLNKELKAKIEDVRFWA